MNFRFKLSHRLARLRWAHIVALPAAFLSCEYERAASSLPEDPITEILLTPPTAATQPNGATDFVAVGLTARGDTGVVLLTWTASGGVIENTSSSGGRHYARFRAGSTPGTYSVTARDTSGTAATAQVSVVAVPVAAVQVNPASASVGVGRTVQLTAVLRDAAGNILTGRSVAWASANAGVASVNGAGLVTGVAEGGPVSVSATSDGVSSGSAITVTAPPADVTPPSIPQNLAAVANGPTSVALGWSASTDDVGVTGYRVFRNGTAIATPSAPAYQDGTVSPSTTYSYTVAAEDAAGNVSPQSGSVSVTTPAAGGGTGSALPARLPESTGTVFYVATNGSDANPGTLAAPWRTIQKALNTLQPGQKTYVRGGTYLEGLRMGRAGTAAAPITIEAYPGERPIVDAEHVRRPLVMESTGGYFRIKGFILDRDCCTSGGHIDVYGHDVEIVGNEMRNGHGKGVYTDEQSRNVHIIDNWIHHNATAGGQQDHGIYLQGFDHFVANNVIHDHPDGFGIQIYDLGSGHVVVNNTVTNNGHSGIVVGGSGGVSNVTIRNNILANNSRYGVQHDSSCPTSNVVVENNVIFGNGSGGVQSGCSAISASGNLAADPLFVDPGTSTTRNLRVQAGSPAINAARADYAMRTDILGAVRDAQPDIGAYEF